MSTTDARWCIETKVAGVTFEGRQAVVAKVNEGDWLRVQRDHLNPHDKNACAIYRVDKRGHTTAQVGFVPRIHAELVARTIAEGYEVWAHVAELTGGYEGGDTLGLKVRLRRRRI